MEISVNLSQFGLAIEEGATEADIQAQMSLAESVVASTITCDDFNEFGKLSGAPISGNLGDLKVGDLPPKLQQVVLGLEVNQVSKPILSPSGVLVLMLCDRTDPPSSLPDPNEIRQKLMQQRLDLQARRYMRDLRNQAFVDVRV